MKSRLTDNLILKILSVLMAILICREMSLK